MNPTDFQLYKAVALLVSLALVVLLQQLAPYRGGWRVVLRNWKTNIPLALLNVAVMAVVCGGCVCATAQMLEARQWGLTNTLGWSLAPRIAFTILALDFVAYAWHRANHVVPTLWRFHAVHHSDKVFDVSTALRFHPGELLISLGVRLAIVTSLGLPVIGILAFEMIYAVFNQLEHGNIRLPLGLERSLSLLFVTPALHRKHHSIKVQELNRNFATVFSFWDRLFKTLAPSTSSEMIAIGLPRSTGNPFSLRVLLRMPIQRVQAMRND